MTLRKNPPSITPAFTRAAQGMPSVTPKGHTKPAPETKQSFDMPGPGGNAVRHSFVQQGLTKLAARLAIRTYETQIKKLEEDKLVMQEKIRKCGRPLDSFQETYRTAINFFENPQKLWLSDHIEHKTLLLRMVFAEKLPYDRKEGYRTAAKSLPFSLLEGLQQCDYEMVEANGIEPMTFCLQSRCSTN